MAKQAADPPSVRVTMTLTWVGIGTGLFLLVLLAGIQFTVTAVDPDRPPILSGTFDNLVIGALLVLILVSVVLQVGARIAQGQRKLMAQVHIVRLQVLTLASWRLPATGRATVVNGVREFDTVSEPVSGQVAANGHGRVVALGERIAKKITDG